MDSPTHPLPYQSAVLRETARLLSLQDREAPSRTYGCFDRTYWGWKFTDFPGARFQEGVYSLAHLFCHEFPGSDFAGYAGVLEWALAGLRYWQSIQYRDGSFDEAYPYEHSLAATAFTGFYVGEAVLLLGEQIPPPLRHSLRQTFVRAGDWLCRNDEYHGILSNHLAVAAAALQVIARIAEDERYERRSQYFLNRIYAHQSSEGWYEEYGGADPGYQTHGTFYLARIWQYTQDAQLLDSLARSLHFLKHFIHPNRTLGGEYGSRNTQFYFPAGLEMLASQLPDARLIAQFMRPSVGQSTAAGLRAMDAYNFMPMLNNYLFASLHEDHELPEAAQLPCQTEGETYYPDAGLVVKSTPRYYAVLGLSKGSVLKVYDRATEQLAASDCGYWARLENGAVASSQNLSRPGYWQVAEGQAEQKGEFVRVNARVQQPWLFIAFRLFTLTLGRFQRVAYWIKDLLVRVLVRRRKTAPIRFTRKVRFGESRIFLTDELELTAPTQLQALRRGERFATIHMGSSRYFEAQDLELDYVDSMDWAARLMQEGRIQLEHEIEIAPAKSGES